MSKKNELPQGWCWAAIDELAHVGTGTTPSRSEPRYWTSGSVPWVTSSAVNQLTVTEGDEFVTEIAMEETTLRLYPKHTLILALYGEGKTRGKVSELLIEATLNQALAAIELHDAATDCRPFLKAFLQSHYAALRRQAAGGMQPNLNLGLVKRVQVPVAPLNEQYRIVAKIEELFSDLDAGVAALERTKAKLKRYRAAVLKAAVEGRLTAEWREKHKATEPASKLLERILAERRKRWEAEQETKFAAAGKPPPKGWREKYTDPTPPDTGSLPELPDGWGWATLEQLNLAERPMSYGVLQPGPDVPDGVPLIRVCDIADGIVAVDQLKRISPAISAQYKRTVLQGGELLLTLVGTIGRTAVAPDSVFRANTARAVGVIALSPSVDTRYVEITLRESGMRSQLNRAAHEVARKTLNLEDVRVVAVPLAPAQEQAEILAEVEQRLSVVAAAQRQIEANLVRSTRLRQSILKRAFEGKLVPQDPQDEPASVLLERLRRGQEPDKVQAGSNGTSRRRTSGGVKGSTRQQD